MILLCFVWEAGDDHPFRALKIKNKKLHSFFNLKNISTNRQSYPKAYFYDQSPWILELKILSLQMDLVHGIGWVRNHIQLLESG